MRFFDNHRRGGGSMRAVTFSLALLALLQPISASVAPSPTSTAATTKKYLTESTMFQRLRKMEYAVRGKVVIAADRINDELKSQNSHAYPFDHIIYTNIGKINVSYPNISCLM
mmetsp:Transcript_46567/g.70282  ORF Transcript_46567/g.70282 Transcript_46567/m.70282 type:complete len:113 (+) Transcript_46567:141-479(+)